MYHLKIHCNSYHIIDDRLRTRTYWFMLRSEHSDRWKFNDYAVWTNNYTLIYSCDTRQQMDEYLDKLCIVSELER